MVVRIECIRIYILVTRMRILCAILRILFTDATLRNIAHKMRTPILMRIQRAFNAHYNAHYNTHRLRITCASCSQIMHGALSEPAPFARSPLAGCSTPATALTCPQPACTASKQYVPIAVLQLYYPSHVHEVRRMAVVVHVYDVLACVSSRLASRDAA